MNFLCLCVFLGVTLADDVPYGYEPHKGEPMWKVCPAIECPFMPPPGCSEPQFKVGLDGVTMCSMCPRDICMYA
ncbi:hypothetical protein DPMN_055345 [Dreissena polymorpha]|uniref:Uncharacterized protein n=1 Tax=Dreissena polymorpha TaxID=45954 RepID=A0A9D4CQL2_DREPO|nr:hypothetical protein DPMN_055345 [Dreissena polymorpha]